jgi:hypothetical protein
MWYSLYVRTLWLGLYDKEGTGEKKGKMMVRTIGLKGYRKEIRKEKG